MAKTIMRRDEVERVTGLSCSTIYEKMSEGTFPRQVPLGGKAVGWLSNEIEDWIEARADERDRKSETRRAA